MSCAALPMLIVELTSGPAIVNAPADEEEMITELNIVRLTPVFVPLPRRPKL